MSRTEDYKILYERMNPELLKPEVQALVNDLNLKCESSGWTVWLRQVLILKDGLYLLMEVEPDYNLKEFVWYISLENNKPGLTNTNMDYNSIKFRNNRLSLIKMLPPLSPGCGKVPLNIRLIILADVKSEIGQTMSSIIMKNGMHPDEENLDIIRKKICEFDLDIEVSQENFIPLIVEFQNTMKVTYTEEKFRDIPVRGKWDFILDTDKLKKQGYDVSTISINKTLPFKNEILRCSRITFYPASFSIRIQGPNNLNCYDFFYEDNQKQLIPSNSVDWTERQEGLILSFYFHCIPESMDADDIVERIRIIDTFDNPDLTFAYSS